MLLSPAVRGGYCWKIPPDMISRCGRRNAWPNLLFEISKRKLRYGSSGALRGMVEAWRKRCGTFYEMPLTSKTSRLGAWVPKSPRCSPALDSTRRFPNCVGMRLSLRPSIDDCSRYERALGAHASISGQAGSRLAGQTASLLHLDDLSYDPRDSVWIADSARREATLCIDSSVRKGPPRQNREAGCSFSYDRSAA